MTDDWNDGFGKLIDQMEESMPKNDPWDKNVNRAFKAMAIAWVVGALISLGVTVTVIWVIVHFVTKAW